jgi:hypothetical protein
VRDYGAEMLLEIARFWASISHFNRERDRFEIHGVMGPDEFHERYPGAQEGGLRNNAYSNVMVAWIAETAQKVLDLLPESRREALRARLGLSDDEIAQWDEMSRKMFVPFHGDGMISQFEGHDTLRELDWDAYRAKYGKIQRLDRILRAEGDDPDQYQLAKQADTVLLFFLFPEEELRRLFERLGYAYEADTARKTIDYYDNRTSHGSTLSFITHAGVLAAIDPGSSWERFLVALESDIADVQGGTTKEGIHMGVMSGTLDLLQRAYVGSEIRDGVLYFKPRLAERLDGLAFTMQFRGTPIRVTLADGRLTVIAHTEGFSRPISVGVGKPARRKGSVGGVARPRRRPRLYAPRHPRVHGGVGRAGARFAWPIRGSPGTGKQGVREGLRASRQDGHAVEVGHPPPSAAPSQEAPAQAQQRGQEAQAVGLRRCRRRENARAEGLGAEEPPLHPQVGGGHARGTPHASILATHLRAPVR